MPQVESEAERIFNAARMIEVQSDRDSYVKDACGADAALRARVKALLSAHDEVGKLLTRPAAAAVTTEQPGQMIGPYKLLELIGEGGFGEVFMAQQEKPLRRRVALKIIKLGMDTHQVVARFELERQALAMMDHPNIARVLDAGATDSGRPYFVMDLVKGDPIAKYCDKNNLAIDERIDLFAQVCNAVQHAHNKGIIHRDIKPSNVLVATQDGRPQAKVIDFGIAKATASKLTDKTIFTEYRQLVGTPEYMSPEQAEGSLDIDTRTDVYSLGVLLYELLTGSTPFDAKSLRSAGYGEIQRIIREVEPPKPSTRLSESSDTLASVAAHRRVEPKRLGTIVRGELDWIVMRALEKDPSRRYETASGLEMDTRRYLSSEAVVAAPPSAAYRLQKFIRRNRILVLAGAAVVAALLIGVVAFAWQWQVARSERDRVVIAEGVVRKRADELKLVSDFQSEMLRQVRPADAGKQLAADIRARFADALIKAGVPEAERAGKGDEFAAQWKLVNATDAARNLIDRTILRPAVETIEKQFEGQPIVGAKLRQVLADLYWDMGLYDAALPLQQQALATRRRLLGEEHPDTLISISGLGMLLMAQGKLSEAEPYLRDALDIRRRVLGEEDPLTLDSMGSLGMLLTGQGQLGEAEPYFRAALGRGRLVVNEIPSTLASINNLGELLLEQGELGKAEPYLRESLALNRVVLGEGSPSTLTMINNLGGLLQQQGKWAESETYYREALEKTRGVRGNEHPDTLRIISNLGELLQHQNKLSEAEPLLREATSGFRRVLGDDDQDTLTSNYRLGETLMLLDKLTDAEPLLREGLERCRRVLGDDNPITLFSMADLALVLEKQGNRTEAELLLRKAVDGSRSVLSEENPYALTWRESLGALLIAQGKPAEAEPLLRETVVRARRMLAPDDPEFAASLATLGAALVQQQKFADAEPVLRECLAIRAAKLPGTWFTYNTMSMLGGSLAGQGKHDQADALLVEGFERMDPPAEAASRKREALERLVKHYDTWGKPQQAARFRKLLEAQLAPASAGK